MAKGLQRLYLTKGSVRWHENELLKPPCIFLAGHLTAINKQEGCAGENNGIAGSVISDGVYDTYSALTLNDIPERMVVMVAAIRHYLNPLRIYCRLRDRGIAKGIAVFLLLEL